MPASWSQKDERQYEAILERCKLTRDETGRTLADCKRIAAATVNKRRSGTGALDLRERDTGSKRELRFEAFAGAKYLGYITARRHSKKVGGRTVYTVSNVYVKEHHRKKGVATKLYEAAAQEACRRRATLASTERNPGAHSTDFWEKQVQKGRARKVRGGKYVLDCDARFDLSGLGKAAAPRPLVSIEDALARIKARHPRVKLDKLPRHIEPFAGYMRQVAQEPLTPRKVVKAYVLTRSSVQRQGADRATVCRTYPEYRPLPRSADPQQGVRPEDVMARILFEEPGQAYLDAAERGQFDAISAGIIADAMACYGFRNTLFDDLEQGVTMAGRTAEVREAIKGTPRAWWRFIEKRDTRKNPNPGVPGIGPSKAGFFAAMLGRGDIPTFDAREKELWYRYAGQTSKDPKWPDVERLRERLLNFPMKIPAQFEPFKVHLVHHALWDAYASGPRPSKTTHGAPVRAMQFAGVAEDSDAFIAQEEARPWYDRSTYAVIARDGAILRVHPGHEDADGEWVEESREVVERGSAAVDLSREYALPIRGNGWLQEVLRTRTKLISQSFHGTPER